MSTRRVMEEATFKSIDPGTYPVTCVAVRPDTLENPQFGDGAVIKFKLEFDLEDDDGEPVTREAMASDYLTPGSKLTRFLFAFGVQAQIGQEIDIDDAIGKNALAVVGKKTKGDKTYDTITDLIPAPKAGKRSQATSAPAQPATIEPDDLPWAEDVPSVINANGSCNWAQFWITAGRFGINEKHVKDYAGEEYGAYDGADAQQLLEALIEKTRA